MVSNSNRATDRILYSFKKISITITSRHFLNHSREAWLQTNSTCSRDSFLLSLQLMIETLSQATSCLLLFHNRQKNLETHLSCQREGNTLNQKKKRKKSIYHEFLGGMVTANTFQMFSNFLRDLSCLHKENFSNQSLTVITTYSLKLFYQTRNTSRERLLLKGPGLKSQLFGKDLIP